MRIGEKDYRIPDITFGFAMECSKNGKDLKKLLPQIQQFDEKAIVSFLSLAFGFDEKKTCEAIDQHFSDGGDFVELIEEIEKAVEESGFFQAWMRTMEKLEERTKKPKKKA